MDGEEVRMDDEEVRMESKGGWCSISSMEKFSFIICVYLYIKKGG